MAHTHCASPSWDALIASSSSHYWIVLIVRPSTECFSTTKLCFAGKIVFQKKQSIEDALHNICMESNVLCPKNRNSYCCEGNWSYQRLNFHFYWGLISIAGESFRSRIQQVYRVTRGKRRAEAKRMKWLSGRITSDHVQQYLYPTVSNGRSPPC